MALNKFMKKYYTGLVRSITTRDYHIYMYNSHPLIILIGLNTRKLADCLCLIWNGGGFLIIIIQNSQAPFPPSPPRMSVGDGFLSECLNWVSQPGFVVWLLDDLMNGAGQIWCKLLGARGVLIILVKLFLLFLCKHWLRWYRPLIICPWI